jgi:hypothetical protein
VGWRMKSAIERVLDQVDWTPVERTVQAVQEQQKCAGGAGAGDELPYATHEGVLSICGIRLHCYRLNTGMAVFDADDVKRFFGMEAGQ